MTQIHSPSGTAETPQRRPRDAAKVATGFVIKLVVLTLVVSLIEAYLHEINWGRSLQVLIARLGADLADVFSKPFARLGNTIFPGNDEPPLIVTLQCTALFAQGLFIAAVVSFPCLWRARLVGVIVGIVGVNLINLVRIAGLLLIARWDAGLFHFAHLVLMQGFLISCVAPLWLIWAIGAARWSRKRHV